MPQAIRVVDRLQDQADVAISSPSNNQVLTYNSGTGKWSNAAASGGFADPTTTKGDLIVHGTTTTRLPVGTNGQVLTADSTQTLGVKWAASAATPSHAYFSKLAALLEPLAIEPFQTGTFAYTVATSALKYVLAAWYTRLDSSGRLDVRNAQQPLALSGATFNGIGSTSTAVILDPTLPTYTDAWTTYYDRLNTLATLPLKHVDLSSSNQIVPFLPGPYGIIITRALVHDFDWLALQMHNVSYPVLDELGDTAGDYVRFDSGLCLPMSKLVLNELLAGLSTSGTVTNGPALATVAYKILPASWGAITDSTTYLFRDDFMGSSLNTASTWTRAQSTTGNVEIDTNYAWCKVASNNAWGSNGAYTQATVSRTAGRVCLADVYLYRGALSPGILGWHDGGGQSYTNLVHGVYFSGSGGGSGNITIFENGTNLGTVGTWTEGTTYRVRITLGSTGATYAIQGGAFATLGGASWTTLSPGTASGGTATPLHVGFTSPASGTGMYVGDVRVY